MHLLADRQPVKPVTGQPLPVNLTEPAANDIQAPYPNEQSLPQPAHAHSAAELKSRTGLRRLLNAAGYSLDGLRAAWRGEAAFRQLSLLAVLLIPLAFILPVTGVERGLLVAVVILSLMVELVNSAIEATVDRISLELHPLSKRAKDLGSAAQLMALGCIAVVWAAVLI